MTHTTRLAVIGAGTMGHGIAYVAALSGYPVTLFDADPQALVHARRQVQKILATGRDRGKVSAEDEARVEALFTTANSLSAAVRQADLVIEAVVENLEVKRSLFTDIEREADGDAVLATNTSSLPIAKVAGAVTRPERVVGMHFFNPVHLMRLVEVVVHPRTDPAARERVLEVARGMSKDPIVVRDSPGFASSRLGVVLGLEAMRMVEQDVASPEDIDKAMELGYRHPMGPLRVSDLVGLDVRLAIADALHAELNGEQYRPPEILREKVARGELGKKTGRGFYTWDA